MTEVERLRGHVAAMRCLLEYTRSGLANLIEFKLLPNERYEAEARKNIEGIDGVLADVGGEKEAAVIKAAQKLNNASTIQEHKSAERELSLAVDDMRKE